jgi:hypothetical protein
MRRRFFKRQAFGLQHASTPQAQIPIHMRNRSFWVGTLTTNFAENGPAGFRPRCLLQRRAPILEFALHVLLALAVLPITTNAVSSGKVFTRPEDAVAELRNATSTADTQALRVLFGPAVDELQNPDRVQATNDLATFHAALVATNQLKRVSETNIVIQAGEDLWPFPIPLVKGGGGWHFDTAAGLDEIINRRIGRNELDVLKAMRAYVNAQREYASRDHSGNGVLKYAQRIKSSPGKMDGLYWPLDLNGEESPLGPLVADAQEEGYFNKQARENPEPQPFHGYYFKILTRQGKHPPGGKYDYVINGNMIGGFAMVAWPVEYGDSGIMTFVVNQQGRVHQKDLGPQTSKLARKMTEYDPDPSWRLSRE